MTSAARGAAIVAAAAIVGAVGAAAVTAALAGDYRSRALLAYVSPDPAGPPYGSADGRALAALRSAAPLVDTQRVTDLANGRLIGIRQKIAERGSAEATVRASEQILEVAATDPLRERSVALANAFADSLVERRVEIRHHRLTDEANAIRGRARALRARAGAVERLERRALLERLARIRAAMRTARPDVVVLEGALTPAGRVSGAWLRNGAFGLGAGALAGLLAAVALRRRLRGTLDAAGIEEALGQPPAATLPNHPALRGPLDDDALPPDVEASISRATRALADALDGGRVVAVTGDARHAGRTTVALWLARRLAAEGRRTLVVEADLGHPALADHTQGPARPGLVEVLGGEATPEDVVVHWERSQRVDGGPAAAVDFVHGGRKVPHPAYLLEGAGDFLRGRRANHDAVIVDAPAGPDARPLLAAADLVCVVARPGRSTREAMERLRSIVDDGGRPVRLIVNAVGRRI